MQNTTPLRKRIAAATLAAGMTCLLGAGAASAKEASRFVASFVNQGIDIDATGTVSGKFSKKKSRLTLKLNNLDPNSSFTFLVNEHPEATFVSDAEGKARVTLKTGAGNEMRRLDFDPRERALEIHDGAQTLLALDLGGVLDDSDLGSKEDSSLVVHDTDAVARVSARHRIRMDGTEEFTVKAKKLPEGEYTLYVDGLPRATMIPSGRKSAAKVKFVTVPTRANHLLLDFDPRHAQVELGRIGVAIASGEMRARIPGVNVCDVARADAFLMPVANLPERARAEVSYRRNEDCSATFDVYLDRMPEFRTYTLWVGGVQRGTLIADGDEYEIEFESHVDGESLENDENNLGFDPMAGAIEIREGEVAVFSDSYETALPTNTGGACWKGETEVYIFTADGSTAQATGSYRIRENCRRSFELDVEGVPNGDYNVAIDGVFKGVIEVAAGSGSIEFSNSGDENLDFNPRGQSVVIYRGAVTHFDRTFLW